MFITYNKVRMYDTDMGGVLFFANQFRFAHDAWEELMACEGLYFRHLFRTHPFTFVVVHAEADYKAPLDVSDELEIHVWIDHIGASSFTVGYEIYRLEKNKEKELIGTVKTVHVTLNTKTRTKINIPKELRIILEKHQK